MREGIQERDQRRRAENGFQCGKRWRLFWNRRDHGEKKTGVTIGAKTFVCGDEDEGESVLAITEETGLTGREEEIKRSCGR